MPLSSQRFDFGTRDPSQTGSSHCFFHLLILSLCHWMSPSPLLSSCLCTCCFFTSIGSTLSLISSLKSCLSKKKNLVFLGDLSSSSKRLSPLGSHSVAAFPRFTTPPSLSHQALLGTGWQGNCLGLGLPPALQWVPGVSGAHPSKFSEC